jgi:hypothetical protein
MEVVMLRMLSVIAVLLGVFATASARPVIHEFSGRSQDMTGPFEASSPWMVTWQTRHEGGSPVLNRFEVHLHDAATDDFLGVVTLSYGSGTGDVLIEQSGRFRFRVLGYSDGWSLRVRPISQEEADRAKSAREAARFIPPPRQGVTRQQIGTIRSWRVEAGPTLVIESADGRSFRALFPDGCPGLQQAESLQMISGTGQDWEHYSGVLLDGGQTCEFGQVIADPRTGPQ